MIPEKIIAQKLSEIEKQENVKILYCVESGSRAWGFASPDSDYDVRFIYVRPKDYYLRLDRTRDVIEWQIDDVWDINGWDLQKTLILLHKSNPTVFEWINSPIVYKTTPEWEKIAEMSEQYFNPRSSIYHYLHIVKSHDNRYLMDERVKPKKYFYALRGVLSCKWILENMTAPPILFSALADSQLEENMQPVVDNLLEIKKNAPEGATIEPVAEVNDYIQSIIEYTEQIIPQIPVNQRDWTNLNKIFLEILDC